MLHYSLVLVTRATFNGGVAWFQMFHVSDLLLIVLLGLLYKNGKFNRIL